MIPWKMTFSGIRDYDPAYLDLSGRMNHIMITGPNGAGKSTITYCLGAVLYSSKVDVEGLKSRNLPADQTWRARISLLFRNDGVMKIDAPEYIQFTLLIKQEPGEPMKKEFIVESGDEIDHYTETRHYTSGDKEFNFTKYKRDLQYVYKIDPDLFYLIWYQQEINQFAVMSPEERFRIFSDMYGITDAQKNWEESLLRLQETQDSLFRAETELAGKKQNLKMMKNELNRYEQNRVRLHEGGHLISLSLLRLEYYFKRKRKEYIRQVEQLMSDREELNDQLISMEEMKERVKEQSLQNTEEKNKTFLKMEDIEQEIQLNKDAIKQVEDEIRNLKAELSSIEEEGSRIQRTEEQVNIEIESTNGKLANLQEKEQSYKNQTEEIKGKASKLEDESRNLEVTIMREEEEESEYKKILQQYHSSHKVQLEIQQINNRNKQLKNRHYELNRKIMDLREELNHLRQDRTISSRQQTSLQYFEKLNIPAYPLRELIELDELSNPREEDLFNTIKYTVFFNGNSKGIVPPNDLYHVSLRSVVPDRLVTSLPALHVRIKEGLSEEQMNYASKALWWVEQFFQENLIHIDGQVLHDAAGLRGNQEQSRYILSARALEVRKKQVETSMSKLLTEKEQIEQSLETDTNRLQVLESDIYRVRKAETFMTAQHERLQRKEQLANVNHELTVLKQELDVLAEAYQALLPLRAALDHEMKILEHEADFYKRLGQQSAKFELLHAKKNELNILREQLTQKEELLQNLDEEIDRLEKVARNLGQKLDDLDYRLRRVEQQKIQLATQIQEAEEGKIDADNELIACAQHIEEMKALVPDIYKEASQVYTEQYADEGKLALISLRSDFEKGKSIFDNARSEEVNPAAPENYRIAKENYDQHEDDYKRTSLLLEKDEQRTVELQDLLETTIQMRVGEIQQNFRNYMSLFQFEGQIDWSSNEDRQGRTHFHLYIRARKEGHRGKMEDVSVKVRGGRVGKGVSGGEESLSSLLFALSLLQKLQSHPGFIVLDEFDSALDEQRKNKVFDLYVRELNRKIIILTPKSHESSYFDRFSKAYVVYHNPSIPKSQVVGIKMEDL